MVHGMLGLRVWCWRGQPAHRNKTCPSFAEVFVMIQQARQNWLSLADRVAVALSNRIAYHDITADACPLMVQLTNMADMLPRRRVLTLCGL